MKKLSEDERQLLIALIELTEPITTPNNHDYKFKPASLEEAATYFRSLREDWTYAYESLTATGLLEIKGGDFHLTKIGKEAARQERLDHPPIYYWYREFFPIASKSPAYHLFCERLYGRDLCQAGFSDMTQIDFLIRQANLGPGKRVLDLGCGTGDFANYLFEQTDAFVCGLDFVPEAISLAREKASARNGTLEFILGNFDHLEELKGPFDLITSIDTLYMPNDLPATLRRLHDLLDLEGQILIFYSEIIFDLNASREILSSDGSTLAKALHQSDLEYQNWDFSKEVFQLMRLKHQIAAEMRQDFEAEGNLFIYDFLMAESDGDTQPYQPDRNYMSRYLYQVNKNKNRS